LAVSSFKRGGKRGGLQKREKTGKNKMYTGRRRRRAHNPPPKKRGRGERIKKEEERGLSRSRGREGETEILLFIHQ